MPLTNRIRCQLAGRQYIRRPRSMAIAELTLDDVVAVLKSVHCWIPSVRCTSCPSFMCDLRISIEHVTLQT